MSDYRHLFIKSIDSHGSHLHFAAHSHHLWPDVTELAHQQSWNDAALLADQKWDNIFQNLIPSVAQNIANTLQLSHADSLVFAPNTHEFISRLLSCLPTSGEITILTTDSEFHSAERQFSRLEEEGLIVKRVPVEPFDTFYRRFISESCHNWDMVFFSHVFFNSGFALSQNELEGIIDAFSASTNRIVIDGYHGFMALPTDLSRIQMRAFYLAGGYKYAMAGEGACFMHVPNNTQERPRNTGWFAGFSALNQHREGRITYPSNGQQFAGSTFDPSGLYRLEAVFKMLAQESISVESIHAHVEEMQTYFIKCLLWTKPPILKDAELLEFEHRSHFLTFRTEEACAITAALKTAGIIVDSRADRLRFGIGLYHTKSCIDALFDKISRLG